MIHRLRFVFLAGLFLCVGALFFFFKPAAPPSSFPITEQKAFVIIIPSYNNAHYIEKNLQSVFSQDYDNYRVIYIDDNSRDNTLQRAKQLLAHYDKDQRTTLFHNPSNLGPLANKYHAAQLCQDHEILVFLDGDDFFAHEHVLTTLNQAYANPNIWLTYGNSLNYPSYAPVPKNQHSITPCTCYAAVFKELKIENLFYRGHFYSMGSTHALFTHLKGLAANHHTPLSQILCLKNKENPLSDQKIHPTFRQECLDRISRGKTNSPLPALPQHPFHSTTADLVIFSKDNPLQLYALLESIQQQVTGLHKTTVLYSSASPEIESGYLELKLDFPKTHFIPYTSNFKSLLTKVALEKTLPDTPYVLFATDTSIIKEPIDLSDAIDLLQKTHAYGVYFSHHENLAYCSQLDRYQPLPPYTPVSMSSEALAWQFSAGVDDWNSPNNLQCTLHKKDDLKQLLQSDYDSVDSLIEVWAQQPLQEKIGLFFPKASSLSIISSHSPLSLLQKFHSGLKIELTPLYHAQCSSKEASAKISFTTRD